MSGRTIRSGGILAAGEGSRLRQAGWAMAKPLVPVAGVPLVEHVIENFTAAGITRLALIFNAQEEDCARFVRGRFPGLDLRILVHTTASSLESFQRITPLLDDGPALVSTVDAFCPRPDFLSFAEAAAHAAPEDTVLAVTPFVDDERPLWASLDAERRLTSLGGDSGEVVTAGMYLFPERVRRLSPPATVGRLREFLRWLLERGETLTGFRIEKVVDVDRSSDVALAEALARLASPIPAHASRAFMSAASTGNRLRCWGIYRELAHSPGRETDDAEILRATARQLAAQGFDVELKSPDELPETTDAADLPPFLFVMCERISVVERLAAWERQGVRIVNRPEGIRNTDRERTIALFRQQGVPFPESVLVSTTEPPRETGAGLPCWVKRGDVHATEEGDVCRAAGTRDLAAALSGLRRRGISRAVVQEHVTGDLIKFYGVAGPEGGALSWFQWFYHRDQQLSRHPFDPDVLAAAVARAAAALGLDVFGGDAIATPESRIVLIDVNAWPSFALYRDIAATRIASCLAARFRRPVQIAVSE